MKARNLLISFVTMLTLCWANVLLADEATKIALAQSTVNINEADAETLASVLEGVGLQRAQAIVLYRQQNGKFYSAEELTAVRGIGESTVLKNEKKIRVE